MKLPHRQLGWSMTAVLLGAGLAGWAPGWWGAMLLTAARAARCSLRPGGPRRLDAQVRLLYLGLLWLGRLPGLGGVHTLQWLGLLALLSTGYCLAARLLMLMPWNRDEPLTLSRLRWLFLAPPAPRSIALRWKAAMQAGHAPGATPGPPR